MNILYLDDEQDILDLAQLFFQDHGLSIDTSSSPSAALAMAETKSYDVILSDARMPEMGGLDFYAILRYKLGYTGRFILVSGHYDSSDKTNIPDGIDALIVKPVEFEQLYQLINRLEIKSQ